jgi:hypothetical protein
VCGDNVGNNEVVGTGVETGDDDGIKEVVVSEEMEDEGLPPRNTANNAAPAISKMHIIGISILKRLSLHQEGSS